MTVTETSEGRSFIELLMRVDVAGNIPIKLVNATLVGRAEYLVEIRDFFESAGQSAFLDDTDLQQHASEVVAPLRAPAPDHGLAVALQEEGAEETKSRF